MVGPYNEPPSLNRGGGTGGITIHREIPVQHAAAPAAAHNKRHPYRKHRTPSALASWKRHVIQPKISNPARQSPPIQQAAVPAAAPHPSTITHIQNRASMGGVTINYNDGEVKARNVDGDFYKQEAHNGAPMMTAQSTSFHNDRGTRTSVEYTGPINETTVHGATAAAGRTPSSHNMRAAHALGVTTNQTPSATRAPEANVLGRDISANPPAPTLGS